MTASGLRRRGTDIFVPIQNEDQMDQNEHQMDQDQVNPNEIKLTQSNIRAMILYDFKKKIKPTDCLQSLKSLFGESVVLRATVYNQYKKFSDGNFMIEDEERSGRPTKLKDDQLQELISESPSIIVEEIAEVMNVSLQTVRNHLHQLGYTCKLNKWIPHQLSTFNKYTRIRICKSLLHWYQKDDIFTNIITCDEKWVYYQNDSRKKESSLSSEPPNTISRRGLTNKKVLMCMYWSIYGVEYVEFLDPGQTINSEVYCAQLDKLNKNIKKSWPSHVLKKGVFLHQDNARLHTVLNIKPKIEKLGWYLIEYAPNSPDKAPSDFYLFKKLQDYLDGTHFKSKEETIFDVQNFLRSRPPYFFKDGLYKLPKRWEMIIERNGEYLED